MSDSIRHTWTIAKRELSGYFASPVAYVVIVIFLLLMGFFTFMLGGFFRAGEASLTFTFFRWHPWLYLFLVPAVGMRLWAEERRQGTLELLLTMPITAWQAIVGKFLASWIFLIIALALTFPVVITISYLGDPDMGTVLTGYLGSALLAGAYLAVTCFTSALTRNQVISFILSVVICFFLILCGWEPVTDMLINLDPRSPWFWIPYSATSLIVLFLGCYVALHNLSPSKRLWAAIGLTLIGGSTIGTIIIAVLVYGAMRYENTLSRLGNAIVIAIGCSLVLIFPWVALYKIFQDSTWLVKLVASFSVMPHFAGFQKGVIDSRDLLFFLSVMGFSLFCNGVVIRNLRAG